MAIPQSQRPDSQLLLTSVSFGIRPNITGHIKIHHVILGLHYISTVTLHRPLHRSLTTGDMTRRAQGVSMYCVGVLTSLDKSYC